MEAAEIYTAVFSMKSVVCQCQGIDEGALQSTESAIAVIQLLLWFQKM